MTLGVSLVHAPHWDWLAILYFFSGGLAGGCTFLAAAAEWFGDDADRRAMRPAWLVAFPAVIVGTVLLVVDLDRPERFWHMLFTSERFGFAFKWWSPISVGAWALALFGGVSFLSFLRALRADRAPRGRLARWLAAPRTGRLLAAAGGAFGFFVAAYPGVLLSVTNRPLWSETPWLGALFLLSAASTSAALMSILLARRGEGATDPARRLAWVEARVLLIEVVVLGVLVLTLGASRSLWSGAWGVALAAGVAGAGLLLPAAIHLVPRLRSARAQVLAAVLVLAGGFLLRSVVVLSVENA